MPQNIPPTSLSPTITKIFISYQSQDRSTAQTLANALNTYDGNLEAFFDRYDLRAGAFWIPAIEQAINDADAMVLLIGSHSPGTWQRLEYLQALDKKARHTEFVIIPVLLTEMVTRLPFLYQLHCIKISQPWKNEDFERIIAAIEGEKAPQIAPWRAVNPYRGLLAMADSDGDFFLDAKT